jgi:hypothetical protein
MKKEETKSWEWTIEEMKYHWLSWYLDEGDYQPTEEEADEKIKEILVNLLKSEREKTKQQLIEKIDKFGEDIGCEKNPRWVKNQIINIIKEN